MIINWSAKFNFWSREKGNTWAHFNLPILNSSITVIEDLQEEILQVMPFFPISPKAWLFRQLCWIAQYAYKAVDRGSFFPTPIFDLLESILRTGHCVLLTLKSVLSSEIFQKVSFFCYAIQKFLQNSMLSFTGFSKIYLTNANSWAQPKTSVMLPICGASNHFPYSLKPAVHRR